jgi:hypothetical protein
MYVITAPKSVSFSDLASNGFSPRNSARVHIARKELRTVGSFLESNNPFSKGIEPGSSSYVAKSSTAFLRNSCINSNDFTIEEFKALSLNPNLSYQTMVAAGDILFCKDANIGDCAIVDDVKADRLCHSSGIVRLNPSEAAEKYFLFAALRDGFFRSQLESMTPRGSTIRHAGSRFLECLIADIQPHEKWVYGAFRALVLNGSKAETLCARRIDDTSRSFDRLFASGVSDDEATTFRSLTTSGRFDAGFYSNIVTRIMKAVHVSPDSFMSLEEAGFSIKRGPNLAKRDLGRSIITEEPRPGYDVLIYPSDISSRGFLSKSSFIGARGQIWHLGMGDILFSAEGSVGRVFGVFGEKMKFTTNFHGIIISPKSGTAQVRAGYLAMYLHYLRKVGYFDKVSVGGQGGSFASSYWNLVSVPRVSQLEMEQVAKLYDNKAVIDPFSFCEASLGVAGLYQLSELRLRCAVIMRAIMQDLNAGILKQQSEYELL